MSTLGPEAQALVDAGRDALRPTAVDRDRVFAAVQARIAGAGAISGGATPSAVVAKGVSWPTLSATVVGLAVVGGVLFQTVRKTDEPRAALPATASVSAPSAPAPVTAPAAPGLAAVNAASAAAAPAPATARRPADRLAEEVAILSHAETELHAGHFSAALRLLDDHRREFPRGRLTQERIAARIQALCALGRVSEAETELGVLSRVSPGSPHEGHSRAACAANPPK
jgi:hypothetical protein